MTKKIIIGSRGSKLALLYAQKAKEQIIKKTTLDTNDIEIKSISTKGDQVKDTRLSDIGGKGLFSTEIEKELENKSIDIAVHALKDMPATETSGLKTDCFLERNDPREILITNNKKKLNDLKLKSIIGTSSFRREFQIKKLRSDLTCKIIRGNVDTRIKKLKDGNYDAIILSYAGIKNLNLENEIAEIFSAQEFIPSAGQGIIAIQCNENNQDILRLIEKINDKQTRIIANTEREVLKILEGDCDTAIGVFAIIKRNKIELTAELFSVDGKSRFFIKEDDDIENHMILAKKIAGDLKIKSKGSYKV